MLYEISGIKSHQGNNIHFSCLIACEQPDILKHDLESKGIIILHMNEKESNHTADFGSIFLKIKLGDKNYHVITDIKELLTAYELFAYHLDIEVITLNDALNPLRDGEIKEVIAQWKKRFERQKIMDQKEKQQEVIKQSAPSRDLVELRELIDSSLEELPEVEKIINQHAFSKEKERLKDLSDQLKRLRQGSNIQKMGLLLEQFLMLINKIEKKTYEESQDTSDHIADDSIISKNYLQLSSNIMRRISYLNTLGKITPVIGSKERLEYGIFGKRKLYSMFFYKDFSDRYSKTSLGSWSFNLSEMVIITTILLLFGILLLQYILLPKSTPENFEMLTIRGIIGIGIFAGKKFIKIRHNTLLSLLITGLICFGLRYFLVGTFAL